MSFKEGSLSRRDSDGINTFYNLKTSVNTLDTGETQNSVVLSRYHTPVDSRPVIRTRKFGDMIPRTRGESTRMDG